MFQQAAIAVVNGEVYQQLHALLDAAFAERDVDVFLHRVRRSGLRIRNYEGVLERGLLGKLAASLYRDLPVSDQAQTRERFLQMVEAVSPELRQRYAKVFTQY
jgi:hypothetical protein